MKVRTLYRCEICSRDYDGPEGAEYCESMGKPPDVPIGLIVGSHLSYQTRVVQVLAELPERSRHTHHGASWWAFRDRECLGGSLAPAGYDSTGTQRTPGPSPNAGWSGNERAAKYAGRLPPLEYHWPAYARAHAYVQSLGLEPTVWLDGHAQPAPEPTNAR